MFGPVKCVLEAGDGAPLSTLLKLTRGALAMKGEDDPDEVAELLHEPKDEDSGSPKRESIPTTKAAR